MRNIVSNICMHVILVLMSTVKRVDKGTRKIKFRDKKELTQVIISSWESWEKLIVFLLLIL